MGQSLRVHGFRAPEWPPGCLGRSEPQRHPQRLSGGRHHGPGLPDADGTGAALQESPQSWAGRRQNGPQERSARGHTCPSLGPSAAHRHALFSQSEFSLSRAGSHKEKVAAGRNKRQAREAGTHFSQQEGTRCAVMC